MSAYDKQVGGGHYTKMKIQPFQYSMANGLDPMQHTIIKYVTRFRDKNGVEDLKKAIHTIELLIEHEELKLAKPKPVTSFVTGRKVGEPLKTVPVSEVFPAKNVTVMGLPLPLGTNLETVYDLQEILLDAYGGRSLPEDRYQAAQELYKKQASLVFELKKGEHTANIIATSYGVAQCIARQNQWPVWNYCPVSSNLKGINDRVFIIAPKAKVTSTTLSDLHVGRNIVIQLS